MWDDPAIGIEWPLELVNNEIILSDKDKNLKALRSSRMGQDNIVILGAGIAGIGAGYKLGKSATLYEKRNRYGGLCDNFTLNGF